MKRRHDDHVPWWRQRQVLAYLPMALVVVAMGFQVEENADQATQIESTAAALRIQSAEFCERVADGRDDIQVNREILLKLVEAVLARGLDPALVPQFEKAERKLREPVPTIGCARFK